MQSQVGRETKRLEEECERKEHNQHQHQRQMQQRRSHQPRELEGEKRHSSEFYVVRKDVDRLGRTARCPGCADVSVGISVKHAHKRRVSHSNREVVDG